MSDETQTPPEGGPEAAGDYTGPGYPTVSGRRKHLRRLALATGAAAVGTGLFVAGRELVKPTCSTEGGGGGLLESTRSWLSGLTDDPPPHAAGGMRPIEVPEPDPRVRGDMAVPQHVDPSGSTCELPPRPVEDMPRLGGEIAAPEHVEPPPEPEDFPRIKGKVAMPRRGPAPEPPLPMPGGLTAPDHVDPVLEPAPEPTTVTVQPSTTPGPPAPSGTVEGALRSLYLTGARADGTPFTVLVRVDPEDEGSYEAVKAARKQILTALSPLVGTPALAEDQAASKLVTRLVPGATIRFAGVLR